MALSSYGETPARRKPPETAVTENELEKRSRSSFGKSIFRMVFRWFFRKQAETRLRHLVFAGLK